MAELITKTQLEVVIKAAITAELDDPQSRRLLLDGIARQFRANKLPRIDESGLQLRSDLNSMRNHLNLRHNTPDRDPDYRAHLDRWLENAISITSGPESKAFKTMRRLIAGAPAGDEEDGGAASTSAESRGQKAPITDEPLFAWVHISDIHFSHGDAHEQWDQRLVLDELVADFANFDAEGIPAPHAVLVTGDLAYSGGANKTLAGGQTEYGLTRDWLETVVNGLDLALGDVFLVPGNHDVNWAADNDHNTRRLRDDVREGEEKLDVVLRNDDGRARLFGRHEHYLEFAKAFADPCAAPFWKHKFESNGLAVRLIGLDTALVAWMGDEGKLFLGLEQWATGVSELAENELVIVLTHHPLRGGWLGDEASLKKKIRRRGHIHLCGHIHEGESAEGWAGGGHGHVEIIAGAAHAPEEERILGHGYNVAAVYAGADGNLELRVWPRRWSINNDEFRADVDNTLRGKAYARHRLDLENP